MGQGPSARVNPTLPNTALTAWLDREPTGRNGNAVRPRSGQAGSTRPRTPYLVPQTIRVQSQAAPEIPILEAVAKDTWPDVRRPASLTADKEANVRLDGGTAILLHPAATDPIEAVFDYMAQYRRPDAHRSERSEPCRQQNARRADRRHHRALSHAPRKPVRQTTR